MKLYSVSDDYINYLRKFEDKVMLNTGDLYIHTRKYLGTVINIDGFKYYCPLSSGKRGTDYFPDGTPRPSVVPIIRIVGFDKNGKAEVKGTLLLSNMIPVPDSELIEYDHQNETERKYKDLIDLELEFININKELIKKNANRIYKEKKLKLNHIGYIKNTINFKLLEKRHDEWVKSK